MRLLERLRWLLRKLLRRTTKVSITLCEADRLNGNMDIYPMEELRSVVRWMHMPDEK